MCTYHTDDSSKKFNGYANAFMLAVERGKNRNRCKMKQTILIILHSNIYAKRERTVNTWFCWKPHTNTHVHSNDDHFIWSPKMYAFVFSPTHAHSIDPISHDFVQIEQIFSFSPTHTSILCCVLFFAWNNFVLYVIWGAAHTLNFRHCYHISFHITSENFFNIITL